MYAKACLSMERKVNKHPLLLAHCLVNNAPRTLDSHIFPCIASRLHAEVCGYGSLLSPVAILWRTRRV